MLCQNCGKNEVTFRYTQIINGVKKEMALCDKCARTLGLESLDFNMPINFSNFLGNFLNDALDTKLMPSFTKTGTLQCDNCGMTYNEFVDTGKFGCSHCYDIFADTLDSVLKNIHGSSVHVGRKSHLTPADKKAVKEDIKKVEKSTEKTGKSDTKEEKLANLSRQLKQAIQEERYEDAAKIRDEIKKLS
ncbi:MAG: UvrB/UvrC motif-containing protein [Clostridia bacterium]|nr:UvrB/UvrC motif-containing protein [Clostridia bacterium]